MQLYYNPMSSNARRVLMAADHLGLRLELIELGMMSKADERRPEELNGRRKIPVLVDGGFVLWESCAIMQYMADSQPRQSIYPRDPLARADINRWMFWACQHFTPAVGVLAWEQVWKKMLTGLDADEGELARGAAELARAAAVLDRHLAGRRWLSWDGVSLADYAVAAPLMYKERARLPLDAWPHLLAWFDRVQALPAWRNSEPVW